MKSIRQYIVFCFALCSLSVLAAEAPAATIVDFKGKVEILNSAGTWDKAEKGMTITQEQTISTGFNSWAVISLGASKVRIEPVTRITLDQLADKGSTVKTSLYLRVGKVKADVKSTDGKKNDFSVSSPYSTASVRGTSWTQSLRRVTVHEGAVAVRIGAPVREKASSARAGGPERGGEEPEAAALGSGEGESLVQPGESVDLPSSLPSNSQNAPPPVPYSNSPGAGSPGSQAPLDAGSSGSSQTPSNRGSLQIEWFW